MIWVKSWLLSIAATFIGLIFLSLTDDLTLTLLLVFAIYFLGWWFEEVIK